MSDKQQVADDLRGTAEYIKAHGWHQGSLANYDTGAVCLVGGLHSVIYVDGSEWQREHDARQALVAALGLAPGSDNCDGIPTWNDTVGRTVDDVLNACEKTALWVEEQA